MSMRKEIKQRALRRLRILEGQVRGLQKMVQDDKYCLDIINQSLAIKQALSGVEDVVLENHLSTHVLEQVKSGQKGRALKEYLAIYKLSRKK
ncbi:MAG: metal-sensing transcriptional repressor [bacterium]|nr:metal-sensing transcriptional repressor [bacterium]